MAFTDNTKSELNRNAGFNSDGTYTVFGDIPKGIDENTFVRLLEGYTYASHPGVISNYVVKLKNEDNARAGFICSFLVEAWTCAETSYSLVIKPKNPEKDNLDILLANDYSLGEYITWDLDKNNVRYPRLLNYFIIKI